jgi:hypothetical protein
VQSGIISQDAELNRLAQAGGTTIQMPFFADLTGASEVLSGADGALTVNNIDGTKKDVARLHLRGKAFGVNDLAKALSGADPASVIGNLVAGFWVRDEQAVLIASLNGMFADNVANDTSDLLLDLSIADGTNAAAGNKMSGDAFIEGAQLLGDAGGKLVAVAMHSRVRSNLKKLDLITTIRPSDGTPEYETYQGRRVIIDDGCPVVAGGTSGFVYTSYMFGAGAIGRGDGAAPVPTESGRDILSSKEIFVTRRHYILHPRGIAWQESACVGESPTDVELATAANWSRVYDKKNIRIVAIKTNG